LSSGSSSCYTFAAPDGKTTLEVSITVTNAVSSYILDNCYQTDDPVISSTVQCHCPLSPLSTGSCPCPSGPTSFPELQFCTQGLTLSTNCGPFRSPTSYCANIGLSIFPRYLVCDINPTPQVQITVNVCDTFHNTTETFLMLNPIQTFVDSSNKYNFTVSVNPNTIVSPGSHYIKDQTNGEEYTFGPGYVNSILGTDPSLFGSVKIFCNGTKWVPKDVQNSFTVDISNCGNDAATVTSPLRTFRSIAAAVHPTRVINDIETPILSTGFMFYDFLGQINYYGLGLDGLPLYGPNINQVFPPNMTFLGSLAGCVNLNKSNSLTGYNYSTQNCNTYIALYQVSPYACYGQYVSFTYCSNGLVMPGYCYSQSYTSGSNYLQPATCWCDVGLGYVPIYAWLYPQKDYQINIQLNYTTLTSTLLTQNLGVTNRGGLSTYDVPLNTATGLLSLTYQNMYITFKETTTRPKIVNVNLDGYTLTVVARSLSNAGVCYLGSFPTIISVQSLFLTTVDSSFTFGLSSVNFMGTVNFTLTCGQYSDSSCLMVSLCNGVDNTTTTFQLMGSFNPFDLNDSGIQWYIWVWRVFVYLLLFAASSIILYLLYRYWCKIKMMFMPSKQSKDIELSTLVFKPKIN
jgi:hypothetical protein